MSAVAGWGGSTPQMVNSGIGWETINPGQKLNLDAQNTWGMTFPQEYAGLTPLWWLGLLIALVLIRVGSEYAKR